MGEKKVREALAKRDRADYENKFLAQYNALVSSCLAYDSGALWEMPRIANSLSMLCHDGSAPSLMAGIDYRAKFRPEFLSSSSTIGDTNMLPDLPLAIWHIGSQNGRTDAHVISPLDDSFDKRWIRFGPWWSIESVARFPPKLEHAVDGSIAELEPAKRYSRRDIVQGIRNAEGGAHVDPLIHTVVEQLSLEGGGLQAFNGDDEIQIQGTALACSVRQIGHELIRSIGRASPELVANCLKYPDKLASAPVSIRTSSPP